MPKKKFYPPNDTGTKKRRFRCFQGGRHADRVQIIKDMEAELYKPEAL